MHPTTVRFSDDMWRLIETEAGREGVSASQYIRESVILRAALEMMQRGDAPGFRAAVVQVRRLLAQMADEP